MATVVYYRNDDGTVPLLDWLERLPSKARLKSLVRIQRLEQLGHELRRPEADYLRDGIYELRASYQGVHYRMLYFFHEQEVIVVSHGLAKEQVVQFREVELARKRKEKFEGNPSRHSFRKEG